MSSSSNVGVEIAADHFAAENIVGCCIVTRNTFIRQVGLLDENYFFYGEDSDWCKRSAEAGWANYCFEAAEVVHLGGESSRPVYLSVLESYVRSSIYYHRRHSGWLPSFLLQTSISLICLVNWLRYAALRPVVGAHGVWYAKREKFHRRLAASLLSPRYASPTPKPWRPVGL